MCSEYIFIQAIGVEVAGTGVTCNAICPGYVETPCKFPFIFLKVCYSKDDFSITAQTIF